MTRFALLAAFVLLAASSTAAQPQRRAALTAGAQTQRRPVVVELFTSQGCSSCPPADAFLSDLAREGMDVLPLGFHVTYWNGLGWRDPYSLDAATARQRQYASRLGLDSVYTPQMVVDGRAEVVGSDRRAALDAIREAVARGPSGPALHLARSGERVIVDAAAGTGSGTLWLIGYDPEHRTAVGHGENAGRSLTEANVVRGIVEAGHWTGEKLRVDTTAPEGQLLAAILQGADGSIIAAARDDRGG